MMIKVVLILLFLAWVVYFAFSFFPPHVRDEVFEVLRNMRTAGREMVDELRSMIAERFKR